MFANNTKINSEHSSNVIYWLFLGMIILLVVCIRARILEIPLERDEGEYAYCGQLLLQMVPPFKAIYTMKLPGTCFAYSLIMLLFGQTIKGIHLGLLIVNCFSIILLFLITKKLLTPRVAIVAALSYALLSVSPTVLGFAAHATHFIVLTALAGTWILLYCLENGRLSFYWVSGFLFGLAFLMKQQGVFFIIFGGCLILQAGLGSKPVRIKAVIGRLLVFGAGAAIPFIAVLTVAWLSGSFSKFWFWTFKYAAKYANYFPLPMAFDNFKAGFLEVVERFEFLWLTAILGLPVLFIDKRLKDIRWFMVLFILCSFLAVSFGFYFRQHYFIVFLPAVAILIAIVIDYLQYFLSIKYSNKLFQYIPLLLLISGIAIGIYAHKNYFIFEKPMVLSKDIYGVNPFSESINLGEFLKSRTKPYETIGVLGSEPEIFFYSQRRSATGYIYTYGLMENHDYSLRMQKEMIAELEQASPKFLILVKIIYSWLIRPESNRLIFNWFRDYSRKYYQLVGKVDIVGVRESRYLWGEEARTAKDESPYSLLIYERLQVPDR